MTINPQLPLNHLDMNEEERQVERISACVATEHTYQFDLRPAVLQSIVRSVLRQADVRPTTAHYRRVRDFMLKLQAGRNAFRAANGMSPVPQLPTVPTDPGPDLRILRARLILEEALETITALGVEVKRYDPRYDDTDYERCDPHNMLDIDMSVLGFGDLGYLDPVGVADGCADISVVTIGTLIECGIQDGPVLRLVDDNNASKNGPGSCFVADKLQKPPGFKGPDIAAEIARQKDPS